MNADVMLESVMSLVTAYAKRSKDNLDGDYADGDCSKTVASLLTALAQFDQINGTMEPQCAVSMPYLGLLPEGQALENQVSTHGIEDSVGIGDPFNVRVTITDSALLERLSSRVFSAYLLNTGWTEGNLVVSTNTGLETEYTKFGNHIFVADNVSGKADGFMGTRLNLRILEKIEERSQLSIARDILAM